MERAYKHAFIALRDVQAAARVIRCGREYSPSFLFRVNISLYNLSCTSTILNEDWLFFRADASRARGDDNFGGVQPLTPSHRRK